MRHISLFNGIGGFQLAAQWMGWENVASCEIDPFCNKVTKYHFPNTVQHGDIKTTDFTIYRGSIDILTGGFPCQPFSQAGQRKGTADNRYLWPEMLRAIGEIQPEYVVGENVYGLINWDGGVVFEQVCVDLEKYGYEVWPVILPACSVDAPHLRNRVWFVAHRNAEQREWAERGLLGESYDGGRKESIADTGLLRQERPKQQTARVEQCNKGVTTNACSINSPIPIQQWRQNETQNTDVNRCGKSDVTDTVRGRRVQNNKQHKASKSKSPIPNWERFPTQSPVCSRDDGLPGRLDGITFPSWRSESIKGYGNAIVPQVAYQIFKAIENAIL